MKTIYKYRFVDSIAMPEDAQILDIQTQDGQLQMWVLVDTEKPMITRKFLLVGTGQEIKSLDDRVLDYLKTYQYGKYVWHIFERKEANHED